jgi:mRNA-degrading endonuclease RelE of RelBE toxin-antitoxin system
MRIGGFHPAAQAELDSAAEWYEAQRSGLGFEFLEAVREGLKQVGENPWRWPSVTSRSRRYRLRQFPYGIVYQVHVDEVWIVAIMHLKRRPGYWRERKMGG